MTEDVFSFDDFLSKNGGKKPSTSFIKEKFLEEVEQESVEMFKESHKEEEENKEEDRKREEEKTRQEYRKREEEKRREEEKIEEEEYELQNESAFIQSVEEDDDFYKLYQDKEEEFSCEIMIEGSSPEETYARIIIESENWSLVFPGEIRNGKCIVPIKKLNILKEGEVGNIKLEVVAEGNLFIPWENQFKVKLSKKVTVNVNEGKKSVKKPIIQNKIGVKVNFK
jgi:hypothetical protein